MKKMKYAAYFIFVFFFILEVNSQDYQPNVFNKDDLLPNEYDDVDADIENTRLRMLRLSAEKRSSDESWTGRWLPERITEAPRKQPNVSNSNNMWQMINSTCDDGVTNLTVDWDLSPINYTCYHPSQRFIPDNNVIGGIERYYIPFGYSARHVCMSSQIEYESIPPTFGPHRPAWPKYGEYQFVPHQRWLHNLEHGAVVMLYHPCANPLLVERLRKIVTNCLYKHIITPYTLLPHDRPLALLTWGWKYTMPDVDVNNAVRFIREHALKGPESTYSDGQYTQGLLKHAEVVSSIDDKFLCPNF